MTVAPHVAEALASGRPVVALESTVLTHGLPRPANLALAHRLERAVSDAGAVPATVGVVDGCIVVGLDAAQLERLANVAVDKATSWNLAAIVARNASAGTTVATTLHAAAAAGIAVFATGGIGGVHHEPFDESADLAALARYPVVTVSAGPKSVLNAAATLERLETLGVPVLGWRSDRLAGFHVPLTELALTVRVDEAAEVAAVLRTHRQLGLSGGVLVSQSVDEGLDAADVARWSRAARDEVHALGVRGKAVTPALLAAIAEGSAGATVAVNVRLLEANARLAAAIAKALATGTATASAADPQEVP
ncbi:MAG: pseudouridine-5'-phosphate glycosidase [bacterium]|nr:pseudouridine-5'-phosphate glycosidase [bacterium]